MAGAYLAKTGAICSIGIGPAQVAASFRAGLSRFAESSVMDRWFEPVTLALLPEDALAPLADELAREPLRARERRMLRLAAPALRQVGESLVGAAPPLFVALPDKHPEIALEPVSPGFLERLAVQSALSFDLRASASFAAGGAGGLLALEAGLAAIASGHPQVIVGGVDSFLDLRLLATLGKEGRILGPRVMDGFVPGEGAAFVLLSRAAPLDAEGRVAVLAVGVAQDGGHRYATQPARGEGLSHAIDALLEKLPEPAPVQTCFAGLNGESFGAKEWGVARVRHRALFAPHMLIEHPADCFADVGAAMGAMLLVLADTTLRGGERPGPALVWASSDGPSRGCAYLTVA